MKFSELSTDAALDVMCEMTPYINNIVSDEELLEELKSKVEDGKHLTKAEMIAYGIDKANALVAILLKKKRKDVYGILGALNNKEPEEIAKQNFIVTGNQVREIVKDRALLDFFKSFVVGEGNG